MFRNHLISKLFKFSILLALTTLLANCSSLGKLVKRNSKAEEPPKAEASAVPETQEQAAKPFGSVETTNQDNLAKEVQVTAIMSKMSEDAPTPTSKPKPAETASAGWSYTGKNGPANWAKINPAWGVCASGKQQSPIKVLKNISGNYR